MKTVLFAFILVILYSVTQAQDTFSIVAIDSVTGEIGSAGASCVGSSFTYPHGAAILSDVIPGIGAIHTQAAWDPTNQQNAHDLMTAGNSPQEIIDWLIANDAGGNPTTRQYGIVDYNGGHPRGATYTGINCMDYKNDTNGFYYCIQGNILLGQQIIDSMQNKFLGTPGTLAERLMAALQGAKVTGADTRCASRGTSSQSSFLRVARPADPYDTLYCDLWMAYPTNFSGMFPVDPIDSLQTLFNLWESTVSVSDKTTLNSEPVRVFYGHNGDLIFDFSRCRNYLGLDLIILDISGRSVYRAPVCEAQMRITRQMVAPKGVYIYQVLGKGDSVLARGKITF